MCTRLLGLAQMPRRLMCPLPEARDNSKPIESSGRCSLCCEEKARRCLPLPQDWHCHQYQKCASSSWPPAGKIPRGTRAPHATDKDHARWPDFVHLPRQLHPPTAELPSHCRLQSSLQPRTKNAKLSSKMALPPFPTSHVCAVHSLPCRFPP